MASSVVGTRWAKADRDFRRQLRSLAAAMETKSLEVVANGAGIKPTTLYRRYNDPSQITKREERLLASLFERNGMVYDPSLGERVQA